MNLFDQDGRLDSDVEDALSELGNVGVGMASITIGRILGVRVELEAPSVIPAGEAGEQSLLSSLGQESIGIWMKFAEPLSGSVLCVLKRGFVYDVVEKMTGQRLEGEALYADEMAFSALAEFANMLSAAYMNAVGKYTGMRIFVTPYRLSDGNEWAGIGSTGAVPAKDAVSADRAIWVETRFQLLEEDGARTRDVGRVVMMPDGDAVEMLMEALGL